jgi:putative endonuclease
LQKRVYQHRMKLVPGFTTRYNVDKLVYYEVADNPEAAIMREKQIKGGSRRKKIDLINSMDPQWQDLYETL